MFPVMLLENDLFLGLWISSFVPSSSHLDNTFIQFPLWDVQEWLNIRLLQTSSVHL